MRGGDMRGEGEGRLVSHGELERCEESISRASSQ